MQCVKSLQKVVIAGIDSGAARKSIDKKLQMLKFVVTLLAKKMIEVLH